MTGSQENCVPNPRLFPDVTGNWLCQLVFLFTNLNMASILVFVISIVGYNLSLSWQGWGAPSDVLVWHPYRLWQKSIYFIGLFSIEFLQFFIYSWHISFFAILPGNISGCDLYFYFLKYVIQRMESLIFIKINFLLWIQIMPLVFYLRNIYAVSDFRFCD